MDSVVVGIEFLFYLQADTNAVFSADVLFLLQAALMRCFNMTSVYHWTSADVTLSEEPQVTSKLRIPL